MDLPIDSMVDLSSSFHVNVDQAGYICQYLRQDGSDGSLQDVPLSWWRRGTDHDFHEKP